jgi:hypothetical protein
MDYTEYDYWPARQIRKDNFAWGSVLAALLVTTLVGLVSADWTPEPSRHELVPADDLPALAGNDQRNMTKDRPCFHCLAFAYRNPIV